MSRPNSSKSLGEMFKGILGVASADFYEAEVLRHLKRLPGGAALLEAARKYGTDIIVAGFLEHDGAGGVFRLQDDGASCAIVRNNFDARRMAVTMYHELRHAKQWHEAGITYSFADFRSPAHVLSIILMVEADAFTQQALACLKAKAQGDGKYLEALYARGDHYVDAVRHYVAQNKEADVYDSAYARGLFAHMMTSMLLTYREDYFMRAGQALLDCKTPQELAANVSAQAPARMKQLPESFMNDYGADYMQGMSARGMSAAIIRTLPVEERVALHDLRKLAADCQKGGLTHSDFQRRKVALLEKMLGFAARKDMEDPVYFQGRTPHEDRVLDMRLAAQDMTAPTMRQLVFARESKMKGQFSP